MGLWCLNTKKMNSMSSGDRRMQLEAQLSTRAYVPGKPLTGLSFISSSVSLSFEA